MMEEEFSLLSWRSMDTGRSSFFNWFFYGTFLMVGLIFLLAIVGIVVRVLHPPKYSNSRECVCHCEGRQNE